MPLSLSSARQELTLLESQLPRQQALFDEVFYPLARLFEVDHPLLETARERILERKAEQKERAAAFERGDWFHSSLKLSLRCPECGDTNEYQVRKIAVNPADPDANMLLAQEFACTSCGTWPNFEFTGDARMTITAELLKLAADSDAGLAGKSDVLIRFDAPLKGRIVPVGEAVSYAHAALDKDPRAVAQWLRLGFCYQQILSRPRHALKYAEQALSLELNAVEAILQKADALNLRGEDESAFALLDNALGSKDHWRFFLADIATPAEFAAQFAELYNELLRRLGKTDRPNLLSSFLGVSKKVGRNDACPCGSGKKYKKCCLANQ